MATRRRPPEPDYPDPRDAAALARCRGRFLMATDRPDLVAVGDAMRQARGEDEWWAMADRFGVRDWAERHVENCRRTREDVRRRVERAGRRHGGG